MILSDREIRAALDRDAMNITPLPQASATKGDGFVWTRRKHYFEPHLNPRVVGRMQLEGKTT